MTHTTALEVDTDVEITTLEFVAPMPGFPQHRAFTLVELVEGSPLSKLQSLEDPELSFLVAPPMALFTGYVPEIDDTTVAELELASADDAVLVVVITAGKTLAESTANLLAPLVINTANHRAKQVILEDQSLNVATPLVAARA